MSKDLHTYINSLPVYTFLLASEALLIGKLEETQSNSFKVNALCMIETFGDENVIRKAIIPLVPHCLDQTSTLFNSHVAVFTPASFELKKLYCDSLLRTKVYEQVQLNSNSSIDLDTTNLYKPNSKPQSDRWNN